MTAPDNAHSARAVLGAQVRASRVRRGMSVRALARTLDVSPATVSQVENGHTGLSATRLGRIADALETTVTEVLDTIVHSDDLQPGHKAVAPQQNKGSGSSEAIRARGTEPQISNWRVYDPLDFDPVLRAALEEILAVGYHGATVRSIAGLCGFSVSGIYHYYTSKQQMLVTILERAMTELLTRAHAARAESRDPVERFGLLIEHMALFHTHRRGLGFVGASEMRSLEGSSRRTIAEMRISQQRMVDEEVEAGIRIGRFRNDHPHEAARAAVTMCTALANWWRPGGPLTPEQTAEQYKGFALALML